ncbi:hypothetical protein HRAG_00507 [Helicobacter bilis ATCC 43879]|uniref:Sulfatase N-terminal domain-containing protein n=2 Tax=Helicobacter TaxID=209 RepID=C3XEL1_9HELI|nr:phosphoethanolamine transferase [Helicobacter bilis]EEO23450.2 hypothetical protein HRAG_00507 [Helicobacter bilis ATCC 43879]
MLTFIIGIVDVFLLGNFQTPLNKIMFQVFLSTNPNEASEFLQSYLSKNIIISLVIFTLWSMLFIVKIPKSFLIKLGFKSAQSHNDTESIKDDRVEKISCYLFIISLTLFAFLYGRYWYGEKYPQKQFFTDRNSLFRFEQVFYYGIKEQNAFLKQYKELSHELNEFKTEKPGYMIRNESSVPKVVLIIGESTQRNYMGIYGYPLQTTPLLQELQKSGNLVVFSDVIAPHAHTNESLQKVLTFSNYENGQTPWFKQQNLINIMRFAGYKSIWLSNQEAFSVWGNAPEAISRHADITRFSRIVESFDSGADYDSVLLPMLDKALSEYNNADKSFYILHLMGTHGGYAQRFPKNFAKFSEKDLIDKNLNTFSFADSAIPLNSGQMNTKIAYINAIYYNDYVVSNIMQRFSHEDCIVIYLSDHGDEMYDFRDLAGHAETIGSRFMIEVPFMIYMSDTFKQKHKDIAQKIQNAQNLPFMTDDFIHAFLDLLDIETKDSITQRSIFHKDYNAKRQRMFSGKDYDRELKTQKLSAKVPEKLWLHRVDEIVKLKDFWGKYAGYEIDVHFLTNNPKKPTPYFDVGHDGLAHSIGLDLAEMFSATKTLWIDSLKNPNDTDQVFTTKFWIDFKNLDDSNKLLSLRELERLCETYKIPKENLVIESPNYEALKVFKDEGFFTSYYFPYYDMKKLEKDREKLHNELKEIIATNNINAVSFAYEYYDFIKSLNLKYDINGGGGVDMPLLTWNVGGSDKNWVNNIAVEAFGDTQTKIILVSEQGNYR